MKVLTLINETPGSRFFQLNEGDQFTEGPTLDFDDTHGTVPDETLLDRAWAVGNRQGWDDAATVWPSTVRSLSVGDALGIEADGGTRWYAVEDFGFKALGGDPR